MTFKTLGNEQHHYIQFTNPIIELWKGFMRAQTVMFKHKKIVKGKKYGRLGQFRVRHGEKEREIFTQALHAQSQ